MSDPGYQFCAELAGWRFLDEASGAEAIRFFVLGLATVDLAWLKANPGAPRLYQSGVYYRPDSDKEIQWWDAEAIYRHGFADCKGLAGLRCAELWAQGKDADILVTYDRTQAAFHVQVITDSGFEDPSQELGM